MSYTKVALMQPIISIVFAFLVLQAVNFLTES